MATSISIPMLEELAIKSWLFWLYSDWHIFVGDFSVLLWLKIIWIIEGKINFSLLSFTFWFLKFSLKYIYWIKFLRNCLSYMKSKSPSIIVFTYFPYVNTYSVLKLWPFRHVCVFPTYNFLLMGLIFVFM